MRSTRLLALALVALVLSPAAGANELYVVNQGSSNISVIDTANHAVVGTVPAVDTPFAVAVAPDGRRAYVTSATGAGVSVVDTAARAVATTIDVGGSAAGVAVSPDGTRVYVAGSQQGTVAVIDASVGAVVDQIPVAGARAVAISPDGEWVYVTSQTAGTVVVIDAATHAVTATIPVGRQPVAITVTPDGRRVYVACAFGGLFGGPDVAVIDTATDTVVQQLAFSFPFAIAAAPGGGRVYVASSALAAIGVGAGVLGSIPVGSGLNAVAVAPDSARAYVPSNAANTVSVVDTATMSVLQAIGVGALPMGVAVSPDRGPTAAFVAAAGTVDRVAAFDGRRSGDPDSAITRYDWDFGDGTSAPDGGPAVSHVYADPGTYHVSLTVTNAEGCSTAVVFTGQTASCNGGAKAVATRSVTVGASPAPECDSDSVAVRHGTSTLVSLACRGDVDVLRIIGEPRHGRLSQLEQTDGTVVYTPAVRFSGADRIRFAASGPGGTSRPATIALTVSAPEARTPRRDVRPPRLSHIRLSHRRLVIRVSERATVIATIERCRVTLAGRDACRIARRFVRRAPRRATLRVRLERRLRNGRYRVAASAVDASGNHARRAAFRALPRRG